MTTATQNPELTPDLVERVMSLSREAREELAFDLFDSLETYAPGPSMETIRRRSEEIASGQDVLLTREQAEAEVRDKMRELGFEL